MRCLLILAVWGVFTLAQGAEIPGPILKGLSAEAFPAREAAQADLFAWTKQGGERAIDSVFEEGKTSEDPEVAERCLAVLKELVMEEYEREGKGYIGITMLNERLPIPEGGDEAWKPVPEQGDLQEDLDVRQAAIDERWGIRIRSVVIDSAADKAGLRRGDLIVGLNGEVWHGEAPSDTFSKKIQEFRPRTEVVLQVRRQGEEKDVKVILGRRPAAADQRTLMFGNRLPDMKKMQQAEKDAFFRQWMDRRAVR